MTVRKKTPGPVSLPETENWLHKMILAAPRPLPAGRFPHILQQAEADGCQHDLLMDVLDLWLNYGYCRLLDPLVQDIELTAEGERHFYQ